LDSDPAEFYLVDDNESTITVIEKEASAKLANQTRTRRVNLRWMCLKLFGATTCT
jgi:hypothetical protein